jgi:hypothetical protein
MDGCFTTQVRQGKVHPSITAKGGSQQREEGLVLVDGQKLSVAQGPAFGWKNEAHQLYFP